LVRCRRPCILSLAAPTKTNELSVTKNNNASARRTKRVEFQKTRDDLDRQLRELKAEGRREQDRFCNSPIAETTHPDSLAYHDFLDRMEKVTEQRGFVETALQVLDELPKPGVAPTQTEKDQQLKQQCLLDFPTDGRTLALFRHWILRLRAINLLEEAFTRAQITQLAGGNQCGASWCTW
jgi:hypothetical protein